MKKSNLQLAAKGDTFEKHEVALANLTLLQEAEMVGHWEQLRMRFGLTLRTVSGIHFSHVSKPGQHFNYDGIALDPLMHRQPGEDHAMVTTVCDRLSKDCMYLESRSIKALQFLHWKYYRE